MRPKNADRLAGLNKERFIVFKTLERLDNAVKILPCPGSPPDPAIDDKFVRVFCHVGMKIVHQHAHRRFGLPAFCGDFLSCGWKYIALIVPVIIHGFVPFRSLHLQWL